MTKKTAMWENDRKAGRFRKVNWEAGKFGWLEGGREGRMGKGKSVWENVM